MPKQKKPPSRPRRVVSLGDGSDEFVKRAAHELRTPLSAIASAIEVLQAGAKETPETRDRFLSHIEAATHRLERLLEALLLLARAQSGEEQPPISAVELEPILEGVVAGVVPAAGVEVDVECPPRTAVTANPRLLEQLLANLAANAAKHTDAGSIRLVASEDGDVVTIEVRDTGHGIEPQDRELIARELARRESPEVEGLGIGLTIVREAVRALGGSVDIKSPSGEGTTARVTLPQASGKAS
ncbi:MAG TPA: HAMP domain-containing sensor histidine kinase [Gaiellaceae bacterium]|nr:HAMP domain-containing sensor histidine kinase [Gaiellaceae bacterium]